MGEKMFEKVGWCAEEGKERRRDRRKGRLESEEERGREERKRNLDEIEELA